PVLGIVPQDMTAKSILLRMPMKSHNGNIRIYCETRAFSSVYEVTDQEVAQTLSSGWYETRPHDINMLIERLDSLFELIGTRHDRQMMLSPAFVDDNDLDQPDDQPQTHGVTSRKYREGARLEVTLTRYERDPAARKACIAYHGATCAICDFNFGAKYGEIGEGFIIAHHKTPLSAQGEEHEVDPTTDMFPVCANCHVMLHQKEPPYTLEELQAVINR
ncbi:MAG: hypothetical protein JXB30_11485, partial [Anaerolineae bacterium]|nr:hypothetical protein [Anaerolineae bacterium]